MLYDSDLDKVERVTLQVTREVRQEFPQVFSEFEPIIFFQDFGDFSINFIVVLRVKEFLDQRLAKHEFIKKLHRRYKEEEIEIPYPSRNFYLRNLEER